MTNWRNLWESHADAEAARYDAMAVAELVDNVREGRFGDYHTIWYSLAKRATPREAAWALFGILESDAPYLNRYHCAAALSKLMQCAEFEPVALSARRFPLDRNLARMRALIEAQIGTG